MPAKKTAKVAQPTNLKVAASSTPGVPTRTPGKLQKYFPWALVTGGLIGLVAAFVLMVEKVAVLKDPTHVPSCNINPILACGSVIDTPQASAFGFPNPMLGLIGFTAVIVVGVSLLAGMRIAKAWYWRTFWAGTIFGVGFIHWLFFQSVYRIGALCPYCMAVWVVTIPIFWYTTLWMFREGHLPTPRGWDRTVAFATVNHLGILLSWYLVIIGLILYHFWYYFGI
ncbi:MAG TPA: vitamin K epoxide reductase family protein [Candidatus Limnocylindria bacterium]|nr:vitamin K epoxide reductase family protein [Candidatus Limnocylindria bacterium]